MQLQENMINLSKNRTTNKNSWFKLKFILLWRYWGRRIRALFQIEYINDQSWCNQFTIFISNGYFISSDAELDFGAKRI